MGSESNALAPLTRQLVSAFVFVWIFVFLVEKIDPCDSREDPVVCAALIGANAYIDLDDVLEGEKEFWKVGVMSTPAKRKTSGKIRCK